MLREKLGRVGLIVLGLVFLLLTADDLIIWYNTGVLPAIEFFLLEILVLVVIGAAIWEARRRHRP